MWVRPSALSIVIGLMLLPQLASAGCSERMLERLLDDGYSKEEIRELCVGSSRRESRRDDYEDYDEEPRRQSRAETVTCYGVRVDGAPVYWTHHSERLARMALMQACRGMCQINYCE